VAAPVHTDPVALVRSLWSAYASGGVDAVRRLVSTDVEWVPLSTGRTVTGEQMFGDWGREHDRQISATVHGFETHGECVLAHGSLRTFRESGFVDVQPSWVYFFRGGRLVRCVGYGTREDALRAITEFEASLSPAA
jgi:ketosteroid isomerase-like protein